MTANLKYWLDSKDKKKLTKKPAAKKAKETKGGQKGKAKEAEVASGSG
jgi:hypothetical protein